MMRSMFLGAALVTVLSGPAVAQSAGWDYQATLYGWVPGLSATVDTQFGQVDSKATGSDVLDNLDFAFMGVFEARHERWSLIADLLYTKLSASQNTPLGLAFSSAEVKTKLGALSGYALYRVYDGPGASIDLGGGFRAFGVDLDLSLNPGARPGRSSSSSDSWVDPLIAGRIIIPFDDSWFATAFADFGGTASDDQTWQALATVGYRFNDKWSVQAGYRQMDLEHTLGGNDSTISLSGPFIGGSFRF